jgi:acyl-CoA reductase-like NAD-dependent aldehyde dehydrogenase
MGKIVAGFHCDRLKKIIDTTKGEIICGGRVDKDINYVEPTVILNPDENDPCM